MYLFDLVWWRKNPVQARGFGVGKQITSSVIPDDVPDFFGV